jgi:hypothetical protein
MEETTALRKVYTVAEFCKAYAISQSYYFQLQARGDAPDEMHVGARTLISQEAADA